MSLQYLRATASTMVVLLHASAALRQAGYHVEALFTIGNAGVDIFFVISGVVMAWIVAPMTSHDIGQFTRARVLRIVPLWWLVSIAAYPLLADDALRTTGNLIRSLLFVPLPVTESDRFTSIYGAGWTLSYEVAFYALVALSLLLPSRVRIPALVGALTATAIVGFTANDTGLIGFYTADIVLEFAVGLAIGWWVRRTRPRAPAWTLVALHVAAWLVLMTAGWTTKDAITSRFLWWGIPAAVIVSTAVRVEMAVRRLPRWHLAEHLGDASYATYLTHLFTARVIGELWSRAGLTESLPAGVLFAVAVVASIGIGSLVHVAIDAPLRARLGRWWPARAAS